MKRSYGARLFFLLILGSCSETHSFLAESQKKAIGDSVRLTLNNYFSDVKKEGLIAEFKYLDSSSDFFWVPPGYSSAISYDSVALILRKYHPFYTSVENSWEQLSIRAITEELASYTGRIRSVSTDTSGKRSDFILVETGIAIKRETGWKLLNGQTSLVENH